VVAIVYRHWDGNPETMLEDLDKFFADVERHTLDCRFNDASYLAAKWLVWNAAYFANIQAYSEEEKKAHHERIKQDGYSLAFRSIGVVQVEPGDIEWRYMLDCKNREPDGRPTVTHQPACEIDS
jgi:hypothetical protein